VAARSRLLLAERNVDRARRERGSDDADAALIFAEQALINAADAVLARDGFGANSHVVRFSYPGLPPIYLEERSLVDAVRSSRNRAQYESGGDVDPQLADRAIELASRAVTAVTPLIR
jgi:HEPN domain-containing protein